MRYRRSWAAANLQELYLSDNQLTGEIPTELGGLANLQSLSLWGNQLTGEIPTELGNLANLEQLRLHYNELSGVVPQTLAGLTMLEHFSFYNNLGLCAPIDDAFQTWLRGISILHGSSCAQADSPEDRAVLVEVHSTTDGVNWTNNANWLSGDLTRQWYGVTNDANGRVNGLFLGDNQLTGEIPPELGNLVPLRQPTWIPELNLCCCVCLETMTGCCRPLPDNTLPSLGCPSAQADRPAPSPHGGPGRPVGGDDCRSQLRVPEESRRRCLPGSPTYPAAFPTVRSRRSTPVASGSPCKGRLPIPTPLPRPKRWVAYSFCTLRDFDLNDHAVAGASTVTVSSGDPLITRYDANNNGTIEPSEVIKAITDYLFGEGVEAISQAEVIKLITLYLFG